MTIGRLHVLTDTHHQDRFSHSELARQAVLGGADVVQFREKAWQPGQTREELHAARNICREHGTTLIVNDNLPEALSVHADGVHLGIEDMPLDRARRELPPDLLLGFTVHTMDELRWAMKHPVDYIGVGPVYGTSSKTTGLPPLGSGGLRKICSATKLPVIAIGSIRPDRVAEVLAAGAYGIAVLSYVTQADNPESATREFRDAILSARHSSGEG